MSYDSLQYYINQTQLKEEYGFTQGLIDTYLPAPTRAENPRNSGWRKMKVWVRDDVERMINENEALHVKLDKLNERRRSRYFNEFLRCMPLQKMKNLCAL